MLSRLTPLSDLIDRPVSRSGDSFTYNDRSEVAATAIGEVDAEYFYDPAGNRTTSVWDNAASVYTANGLNQYGTVMDGVATNALAYDAWGNLTGTRPFSYFYAYDNRLLAVYTNRTSGARYVATYDYDAMQRVHCKTAYSAGGVASRFHRHHYSGRSLQLEDVSGSSGPSATIRYVWGRDLSGTVDGAGGVGGLLAVHIFSNNNRFDLQDFQDIRTSATRSAGGGTWYFPLYDNNGNVTDYVSETGEVVASYAYDAFGRTIAQSGSMADTFPFRFSTKYYDAESGLYYYGYRYYSPELGRWLTRDPIEEDGGDNLYAFCGNNGVATFDALGLQWTISRTGGNFALAQGSYDSIHSLADIIGLAVGDYKKWASPFSEPIPNSPYQILQCVKLRIPNTVIAYWAGDLGSFGKWWVNYNDGVEHLRELGFRVNSLSHGKDAVSIPIQSQLMSATRGKWLQGFYFWGHGYRPYPSQGLTNSRGESIIDYSSISLSYKLGITLLFACDSNSGMGSIASFSPGAIRVGHTGTLYPVNPWGYRVSDYIRHGDQGTK